MKLQPRVPPAATSSTTTCTLLDSMSTMTRFGLMFLAASASLSSRRRLGPLPTPSKLLHIHHPWGDGALLTSRLLPSGFLGYLAAFFGFGSPPPPPSRALLLLEGETGGRGKRGERERGRGGERERIGEEGDEMRKKSLTCGTHLLTQRVNVVNLPRQQKPLLKSLKEFICTEFRRWVVRYNWFCG